MNGPDGLPAAEAANSIRAVYIYIHTRLVSRSRWAPFAVDKPKLAPGARELSSSSLQEKDRGCLPASMHCPALAVSFCFMPCMYCSETVKSRRDERREITAEGTEQHMLQYIAAMQSRFCAPGVCVCVCMYNGYTLYICICM